MGGSDSSLAFVLLFIDRLGQSRAALALRVEQLQDPAGIAEGHDGAGHLVLAIDDDRLANLVVVRRHVARDRC